MTLRPLFYHNMTEMQYLFGQCCQFFYHFHKICRKKCLFLQNWQHCVAADDILAIQLSKNELLISTYDVCTKLVISRDYGRTTKFQDPNLRNIESLRNGLHILRRRIISHFAFFQRDSRKIVITPPTSIFRSTDKSRTPLPHSIYRRPFTLQGRKLQTSTNHYKEVKRLLNQIRYVQC